VTIYHIYRKSQFGMKIFKLWVVFLVAVVPFVAACGGDDEEPTATPTVAAAAQSQATATPLPSVPTGESEKGKTLFATTCAACHGPAGEGVKGLGKDMTTSEFIAGLSDAELMTFIETGRPIGDPLNTTGVDMPPKGGNPALTDAQLVDIIAFIRTIHK
jgi:disulfide bond formation protein DsbB